MPTRRYEILFPVGDPQNLVLVAEAVAEAIEIAGGGTWEQQAIRGYWIQGEELVVDEHTRFLIDLPDTEFFEDWIAGYQERWETRLNEAELYIISYPIQRTK